MILYQKLRVFFMFIVINIFSPGVLSSSPGACAVGRAISAGWPVGCRRHGPCRVNVVSVSRSVSCRVTRPFCVPLSRAPSERGHYTRSTARPEQSAARPGKVVHGSAERDSVSRGGGGGRDSSEHCTISLEYGSQASAVVPS